MNSTTAPGAEIPLLTVPRKDGTEELRVALKSYRGHPFVDVRAWYVDRDSGEWRPGKGATIKIREIAQLASALDEALKHIGPTGAIRPVVADPADLDRVMP